MPVAQLTMHVKSCTLYGHTVIWSYSHMVVQSYIQIFSAWWVTTILYFLQWPPYILPFSFKCIYQMHSVSVNSTQHCISFLPVTQHLEIKRTKKSVVIHSQKECKWKLVGVMIQFSTLIPISTSLHFVLVNIKSPSILKKCSYCIIVYFIVVR